LGYFYVSKFSTSDSLPFLVPKAQESLVNNTPKPLDIPAPVDTPSKADSAPPVPTFNLPKKA
jgi:hypothetical protein